MIASQHTENNAPTSTEGGEGTESASHRKSVKKMITDRGNRGFARVAGFKLRQDKSPTKNETSSEEARERSPVWGRWDRKGAASRAASANVNGANTAVNPKTAAEGPAREGGHGVFCEEELAGAGGCGHLTKLVLKFTTASESDVQPSCEIGTAGASIGKSELNTVSIPSDSMLAPLNHAMVKYEHAPRCCRRVETGGASSVEEVASSSEGGLSTPGKEEEEEGGGFFFFDGGQETDFAAALRVRVGEGNRDWPLAQGSNFSAGLTVFRAHRTPPRSAGSRDKDEDLPEDVSAVAAKCGKVGHSVGQETLKLQGYCCTTVQEFSVSTTQASGKEEKADQGPTAAQPRVEGEAKAQTPSTATTSGRLWLEALAGCFKGQVWEVGAAGATIGRASDNDLSLADKEMSRQHSKIEYHATLDEFYLCDLGSLNGTYMQMVGPYAPRRRLGLGDHLLVGRTGFSVNRFDYGISERIGARPSMEDRSTVIQDLNLDSLVGSVLWPQTFAGVYDGHGGGQASEYLWSNLHVKLSNSLAARSSRLLVAAAAVELAGACADRSTLNRGQRLLSRAINVPRAFVKGALADGGGGSRALGTAAGGGGMGGGSGGRVWDELDSVVKEAFCEAFAAADEEFIATSRSPEAGSTATTCLVLGPRLYIANVGDSRTVLCRAGRLRLATNDHKPDRADEQERVQKAGGFVVHRRVMGELAVSRAFGDSEFKKQQGNADPWVNSGEPGGCGDDDGVTQLITAVPEFLVSEVSPQDHFVVLACDGIFDVLSSEEVVSNVWQKMKLHADAQRCCEDLTEKAIVGRRSRDNVSLVLVIFNKWY